MSHTLNAEILEKVRGSLAAMTGSARILVGLTMSPAVEAALKRQIPPAPVVMSYRSPFPFGVPIIVDPRMNSRTATAYYDRKIWRKRVKEQNRYDRRTYRQNSMLNRMGGFTDDTKHE